MWGNWFYPWTAGAAVVGASFAVNANEGLVLRNGTYLSVDQAGWSFHEFMSVSILFRRDGLGSAWTAILNMDTVSSPCGAAGNCGGYMAITTNSSGGSFGLLRNMDTAYNPGQTRALELKPCKPPWNG